MAKTAPQQESMMEQLEMESGAAAYHDMADGWRLHAETWTPVGEAKAVMPHGHGWYESTQTLGVRRLAYACKSRGIVLVAYDLHWHGLSLEKNGTKRAESTRGQIEGVNVIEAHFVEMSKVVTRQYKLPLIVSGHSAAASPLLSATGAILKVCQESGVRFVCSLYLAPPPSGLAPACCPDCVFGSCCASLCSCVYCSLPIAKEVNPGDVLGPNRNATKMRMSMVCLYMCLSPPDPASGKRPRSEAARTAAQIAAVDVGVAGRIFAGSKDTATISAKRFAEFKQKLPAQMSIELMEGAIHDMLSADPNALQNIGRIMAYVDEQLGK